MRDKMAEALKTALKTQDKRRTSTLRLINAAIQDRDIANRGVGKDPVSDEEILQILAKSTNAGIRQGFRGGQPAGACRAGAWGNQIINDFMPQQLGEEAVKQACHRNSGSRRRRPARHGPLHDRAEGEIPRQDGFWQGQRHRQVDAAIGTASCCSGAEKRDSNPGISQLGFRGSLNSTENALASAALGGESHLPAIPSGRTRAGQARGVVATHGGHRWNSLSALRSSLLAEEGFNVRLDESSPALHFPVGDSDLEVEPAFEDCAFRFVTSRHPIHRLFLADYPNFQIVPR